MYWEHIDPQLFLQRCFNAGTQHSGCCAWGNLPGSLSSGSCHKFPSSRWVICMGSSSWFQLLQRGSWIDMWVSILLAWLPPVSSKFYKMLFGVMVSIRINRAVVLSKAQINSCWHSQNTSPPFGKYHLMTELMKGPQTSNTSTIYKKGMLYMVITLFGKTFLLLFSFAYFSHPFHTSSSTLDPSR